MAAAPMAMEGGAPATTLWWDGIVIAANISDEEADAAFRLVMEGMDEEMVKANNGAAIWLVKGYEPGPTGRRCHRHGHRVSRSPTLPLDHTDGAAAHGTG